MGCCHSFALCLLLVCSLSCSFGISELVSCSIACVARNQSQNLSVEMQGLLLFLIPVSPVLLSVYYWGGNTDMELLERSDESTYPAVAMYPTPESPPLWVTGCQSLGSKEAQTVPAQRSAERCFLCSCLRADTTCLLGFHRLAGLTTQDVVRALHTDLSDLCVPTFKGGIWADGP